MKTCTKCHVPKDPELFYTRRTSCKECDKAASREHTRQGLPRKPKQPTTKQNDLLKVKAKRRDPKYRPKFILKDTRQSDRRSGRQNDLTLTFVQDLIAPGCSYCGETKLKMTLDRVDNEQGHLQANVVAACVRCNYMRRDMPYEAWSRLVPTIRQLCSEGLFGSWVSDCVHRGGV